MELVFSGQIFEKYSNVEFNDNPSSGNPVVPCGRMDGLTDSMTKLLIAFRNFSDALIKAQSVPLRYADQLIAVCFQSGPSLPVVG